MRRWSLAFVLALPACFSEAPPMGPCAVGSSGCACTSGGACDPGLECHAPSQLCFDPECERGSADCPCLDGGCVGSLVCIDDYCQSPPTGTMGGSADDPSVADASADASASNTTPTASADAGGTTVGSASTDTNTDPSMGGSVDSASAETGTATATTATDDAATASTLTGGSQECRECMLDSNGGPCMTQYNDCFMNADCHEILTCIFENLGDPIDCCIGPGTNAYDGFIGCAVEGCAACDGMIWTCGGG
jgi:hypothetical protein